MDKSGRLFVYLRALLTVIVFYGLALAYDLFAGGNLFGVGAGKDAENPVTWPMLLALWWMVVLHWPLLFFFYWRETRVNCYFSNPTVYKVVFTAWYGGIAGLTMLATAMGLPYGGLVALGFMIAVIAGERGVRMRRLTDYGSTCLSLLVFQRACMDVPPTWRTECYVGIGLVQCAFLAIIELVFRETFVPDELPGAQTR